MIKILILFVIVVLSGFLGVLLSAEKKKRAKVFDEFCEFNEKMLLNLKYGKSKVKEVYENYPYVRLVFAGKEVLKGEDGEFIAAYVRSIGTTDAQSQIDYLNERKIQLKKFRYESAANYKKYSSLYIKICLLGGILVAVMLA